jgi:hypothetical protein
LYTAFLKVTVACLFASGHWWLATVPETHSLTVLDISDPEKPREVSRVTFDARQKPHWVAADLTGTRIVLNSDENGPDHRLFIVNFDPQTGSARSSMKHSATGAVTARASAWTASRGRTDFMAMPTRTEPSFPDEFGVRQLLPLLPRGISQKLVLSPIWD